LASKLPPVKPKKIPVRKNVVVDRKIDAFLPDITRGGESPRFGKLGRPAKWTNIESEMVTQLCMLGLTNAELGASIGVAQSTVEDWLTGRVKDPSEVANFVAAVNAGRGIADAKVAGALYARAVGYECDEQVVTVVGRGEVIISTIRKKYPPDVAAAFIWLKNRRRTQWKDRYEADPVDPAAAAKVVQDAVSAALATTKPEEGEGEN